MQQRVLLTVTIAEAQNISAMLLHLLQLVKVSINCGLLGRFTGALHLLQVVHHLCLSHRHLAIWALLDVFDTVIVVKLKRILGHFLPTGQTSKSMSTDHIRLTSYRTGCSDLQILE